MQITPKLLFRGKTKITPESLRKWNLILAVIYAVQGLAILLFSAPYSVPVMVSFLTSNSIQTQVTGQTVVAPGVHQLFTLNLVYLVAAFLFVAAAACLLSATVCRSRYEAALKKYKNPGRWIEYAVTAGLMIATVGLAVGLYDLGGLVSLVGLAVVMSLSGLVMETHNPLKKQKPQPDWISGYIGGIAGILPWIVIAIYILATDIFGRGYSPVFVYIVFVSMLLVFAGAGFNLYLQYKKKGNWANYLYGERLYVILGFAAKSLLAWELFAGVLHP